MLGRKGCWSVIRWAAVCLAGAVGGIGTETAQAANGVCCKPGLVCAIADPTTCAGGGGRYAGDNTTCSPSNPCVLLTGACCVLQPIIRSSTPVSDMPPVMCRGADCWKLAPTSSAIDFQNFQSICTISTPDGCRLTQGTYRGDGIACTPNPCPVPPPTNGACCSLDASQRVVCRIDSPAGCASGRGVFTSVGTACTATVCPQPSIGACCRSFSSYLYCGLTSRANCDAAAGKYEGDGSVCTPTTCPAPVLGVCCNAATATRGSLCVVGSDYTCFGSGTSFAAGVTSCAASSCARSCPCDWDRSGYLSAADLNAFLNDWLAGHGDFNNSGSTDIQDYTEFANCYLGTNPACIR